MKKKQRVSMVVAQLLGLCLSLWSVSAMAECRTYNLYGDLWFSDRRSNQSLSQAVWLTLGPAPNVEVQLKFGNITVADVEWAQQPTFPVCPSGIDCNSNTFEEYEGARNLYTDLNGHWSAAVTLCLDLARPGVEERIQIRPIFKMQNPEWKVVDENFNVYQVVGHTKSLASADPTASIDYQVTGIPWDVKMERAMYVFQSMREAWNFVEVDGGCGRRGQVFGGQPCGFDLGKTAPIPVYYPRNKQALDVNLQCRSASAQGCAHGGNSITAYSYYSVYHEFGHVALSSALREIQAPTPEYGYPWADAHEDWANFTWGAVVDDDFSPPNIPTVGEWNGCGFLGSNRSSPSANNIFVDLYDRHLDCAEAKLQVEACDTLIHGYGHMLFVFNHMTFQELDGLRQLGIAMNLTHEEEVRQGLDPLPSNRAFVEMLSAIYFEEAMEIWATSVNGYRWRMWEIFLMNCVVL